MVPEDFGESLGINSGLSDLPPTITALLGIDPQNLPWLGRNILGSPADEPVIWGVKGWVELIVARG